MAFLTHSQMSKMPNINFILNEMVASMKVESFRAVDTSCHCYMGLYVFGDCPLLKLQ